MGHQPRVLPSVALAIVIVTMAGMKRVKGFTEIPFAVFSPHKSTDAVKDVAVRAAGGQITTHSVVFSQSCSCTSCRTVCKRIFQFIGNRLFVEIARNISILASQGTSKRLVCRRQFNSLEGALIIDTFNILHDSVRHNWNRGIPHHAIRLTPPKVPHREFLLLVTDVEHRIDEIPHAFGSDKCEQRHLCTIGVPKREDGVTGSLAMVHLSVSPSVIAIYVAEERWRHHGVVKCGVEGALLFGCAAFHRNTLQFLIPSLFRLV